MLVFPLIINASKNLTHRYCSTITSRKITTPHTINNIHATKLMKDNCGSILSPNSINNAMNSLIIGSRGHTRKQLENVFDIAPDANRIASQKMLIKYVNTNNSIYVEQNFPLIPEYLKIINNIGNVKSVNFANNIHTLHGTPITNYMCGRINDNINDINGRINDNTEKLIGELISTKCVGTDTKLIITNTQYFKGKRCNLSKKSHAKRSLFITSEKINISICRDAQFYPYYEDGECQAVKIPYSTLIKTGACSKNFKMLIILPKNNSSTIDIHRVINKCVPTRVQIFLPKFSKWSSFSLIETYQKMGINDLFGSETADLSGITPYQGLYPNEILHKAAFFIDKEGIEVAAATAIICRTGSHVIKTVGETIRGNRFFWYYILNPDDSIMFSGEYYDMKG